MDRQLYSEKCPVFDPTFDSQRPCLFYDAASNPLECGFCKHKDYYRCIADCSGVIPLSHSSVQDFITCHHLYYLKNIRGIRMLDGAVSKPIKMGQLWDSVLTKHLGGTDRFGKPIDIPKLIEKYEIEEREIAKVKALYRAYKYLEIEADPGSKSQAKVDLILDFDKVWGSGYPIELAVTGYYDRKYGNYFVENKLSGRPDHYLDLFYLQSQNGTYFLADPSLEYCIMEITRTPDQKELKKTPETPEVFTERCFQDILSRPSHYFIGYDKKTHRYGKKFFRAEFNLDEIKDRYLFIFKEIFDAWVHDGFYKNDRACAQILPGIPCEFIQVCRYNVMSETVFEVRKRLTF